MTAKVTLETTLSIFLTSPDVKFILDRNAAVHGLENRRKAKDVTRFYSLRIQNAGFVGLGRVDKVR